MASLRAAFAAYGATSLFVLLWSSGAVFAELGVQHAPAFAFLVLRFALASSVLAVFGVWRQRWLPARGTRLQVAGTGALITGGYAICYLLSLARGLTPGVLATILGVQPILTLLLVERRYSATRVAGLCMALGGLALVVYRGADDVRLPASGVLFALAALACMTLGAIFQKGLKQAPIDVLPLQNAVSLALCMLIAPFEPLAFKPSVSVLVPLLWLGIVISIFAQLLFYRLVRSGNLVNVTSLFYLVPVVTALMDYVFFGNRLLPLGIAGMCAILLGLALALRTGPERAR
ncbi:DMT family transporter [Trinickia violacea]|uniref:DMT family transporter n=1 Tax=Trinickia violacea TaxID=2571746 RepID=A0A4P8IVK7_9BURK|nr:DMT family transporter [Trinickia violacea]QCP52277.1 DMT family transporter [Trinickia violacea]